MSTCRVAVFARKFWGLQAVKFIMENYSSDLICVGLEDENSEIEEYLKSNGFKSENIMYLNELSTNEGKKKLKEFSLDYIILAWWPYIIKKDVIEIPKYGILNFHNALLPYNAGNYSNFWTLVENCPYGVTIHFIDENIDSGDIVFQKKIKVGWEDTGKTLYDKSIDALKELFIESYPLIRSGSYVRIKQDKSKGSFHYGKELFEKIKLKLDDTYTVRDFLNLLRAQNFPPYEGCSFIDNGFKYEVQVCIRKV